MSDDRFIHTAYARCDAYSYAALHTIQPVTAHSLKITGIRRRRWLKRYGTLAATSRLNRRNEMNAVADSSAKHFDLRMQIIGRVERAQHRAITGGLLESTEYRLNCSDIPVVWYL